VRKPLKTEVFRSFLFILDAYALIAYLGKEEISDLNWNFHYSPLFLSYNFSIATGAPYFVNDMFSVFVEARQTGLIIAIGFGIASNTQPLQPVICGSRRGR
jgi:hypothetical protein